MKIALTVVLVSLFAVVFAIGCFDVDMPNRPSTQSSVTDCEGGRLHVSTGICWQHPPADLMLDWEDAGDHCQELSLAGFDNWFLPDKWLFTEILGGCASEVLDGEIGYCNSCADSEICTLLFQEDEHCYWTSSPHDGETSWGVNTTDGYVYRDYLDVAGGDALRCVREVNPSSDGDTDGDSDGDADSDTDGDSDSDIGPTAPDCDGGKLDENTNLCWQTIGVTSDLDYEWMVADDQCDALYLMGHDDWRLPTREEFVEILDECDSNVLAGQVGTCNSCGESETCNSLFGPATNWYWSSSTNSGDNAWRVGFFSGDVNWSYIGNSYGVRCLRDEN